MLVMLIDVRGAVGGREERNGFNSTVKRCHLLTKQDCYNQRNKVKAMFEQRHSEDPLSVDIMVKELMSEKFNPVLSYDPQGVQNKSFMLGIQTEFQRDIYRAYGTTLLCIDSTHCTNAYDFKLITALVADDYGKGMI